MRPARGGRTMGVTDPTAYPCRAATSRTAHPRTTPTRRTPVTSSTASDRRIISDGMPSQLPDIDPDETAEWLESLDAVVDNAGRNRARYLMLSLLQRARETQVGVPSLRSTDYINTIPPEREPWFPGDEHVERRIRAYIRWNAAIMVHRAQRPGIGVGGHISTYASSASALRGRLQPLLPRQGPPRRRRPDLLPGPRLPRHVRPRLPRGPADRGASSTASARSSRTRAAACRPTRTRG